ncbi:hypothetical protein MEO40_26455, partial [Dolichospermum sp. ST_sed1]|nr:hypothetical protein [Dolichospermum sp. ST_sed1]MDD1433949.1 hypothetical protein [Dolichospermum sp. ST_sed6]MDD1474690.1 hypothetical protein [Dolichospermum sp. ST_sed4]
MSDDSQRNSAVRAATTNIHHVNLQDLPLSTARRLYKGGVRQGEPIRTRIQAQEMFPHSAPPGVTIGNFGFLNTLKDNFYT